MQPVIIQDGTTTVEAVKNDDGTVTITKVSDNLADRPRVTIDMNRMHPDMRAIIEKGGPTTRAERRRLLRLTGQFKERNNVR